MIGYASSKTMYGTAQFAQFIQNMPASLRKSLILTVNLLFTLTAVPLQAQHAGHGNAQPAAHISELLANTETVPGDDSVLNAAPEELTLHFPERVRLVKLALYTGSRDWIDIDFRYDPKPGQNFVWRLPGLQQATYYTADWAILGVDDQLIRGSFSFAFGPDAEAPSVIRAARELLLQQRYGDPDIRYVAPPPTQIILDQDQPSFDPPFVIDLDQQQ